MKVANQSLPLGREDMAGEMRVYPLLARGSMYCLQRAIPLSGSMLLWPTSLGLSGEMSDGWSEREK